MQEISFHPKTKGETECWLIWVLTKRKHYAKVISYTVIKKCSAINNWAIKQRHTVTELILQKQCYFLYFLRLTWLSLVTCISDVGSLIAWMSNPIVKYLSIYSDRDWQAYNKSLFRCVRHIFELPTVETLISFGETQLQIR